MSEGAHPHPDREDDRIDHVQRFEAMLSNNDEYFFDVEAFEQIIEHYLDMSEPRKARQVLDYARVQHPGSVDLLFCGLAKSLAPPRVSATRRMSISEPNYLREKDVLNILFLITFFILLKGVS